jgi:hypothetical protein
MVQFARAAVPAQDCAGRNGSFGMHCQCQEHIGAARRAHMTCDAFHALLQAFSILRHNIAYEPKNGIARVVIVDATA